MGVYSLSSTVLLDKVPDIQRLRQALEDTQKRYSILKAGVQFSESENRHYYYPTTESAPLLEIKGKNLEDILSDQVSIIWPKPDMSSDLMYQTWLATDIDSSAPAAFGISMSHAILDGLSASRLLAEVVDRYNNMSLSNSNENDIVSETSLPIPVDILQGPKADWKNGPDLRKALVLGGLMGTELAKAGSILPRNTPNAPPNMDRSSKVLLQTLDSELVSKIRTVARTKGTSVTGALFAAMASTIKKLWASDDESKISIQQAVDLSSRLMDLELRSKTLGCFVDGFISVLNVNRNVDKVYFWELARSSQDYLRDCLSKEKWIPNTKEINLLLELSQYISLDGVIEAGMDLDTKGRSASALLSNMGVLKMNTDLSNDINIQGYHLAEAQKRFGFGIMLHSATTDYDGKMFLTFSYSDPILTRRDATEFADSFRATLETMIL
eukprot:CAMPEP_0167756908 /NCGR_PEP_ID=MMETSP0110_2-20121227/9638_1 /TAXON_ID=629695 /ORGANISM="Gymnochlora sp., Strain CCMP2014" /LENGTH=439 /DNA_ID=CAMNT_0007643053 /DNA_START=187 /DNA_END=1506 /DNA_ORIENTATION=+